MKEQNNNSTTFIAFPQFATEMKGLKTIAPMLGNMFNRHLADGSTKPVKGVVVTTKKGAKKSLALSENCSKMSFQNIVENLKDMQVCKQQYINKEGDPAVLFLLCTKGNQEDVAEAVSINF